MNHPRGGSYFFVGKRSDILLEKINQASVLLQDRKNKKPGGMRLLLWRHFWHLDFRFRFADQFEQSGRERRIANHFEGKVQARKKAGLLFHVTSHTEQRVPHRWG